MKSLLLLICSIFIIAAAGCENDVQPISTGKPVKVGVIGPLSGPDKEWGENGLAGIKTALKLQPLLENGSKIELVIKDDQNNPGLTRQALAKLAEEGVSSILIISGSESVLDLAEVSDSYKIPILALIATHPDIIKDNNYISQLLFDDDFQASVAALYVRDELMIDEVGVFIDDQNPHSFYLAKEFIRNFESTGGISERISVSRNKDAFTERLKRLQNKDLKLLYLPLDADHVVAIARILDEIGYHPVIMGSDGLQATILLQYPASLHLVNGMLATDPYANGMPNTDYGKKATKLFQQGFDTPGTVIVAAGCEGTSIIISAINRCQNKVDSSCINRMLRNTSDFVGLFSKISIKENGESERPIFLNSIDGSQLKFVVKIY